MRGNTFGRFLSLTTFGESHGPALGAVVDGCPPGLALNENDFQQELNRRRPGQSEIVTARKERDEPEILSGVFEGKTLGTPIAVIVRNEDAQSEEYAPDEFRVGHADREWIAKFGRRDWRGGGRSSGRETLSRVLGGVVAKRIVSKEVGVLGFTRSIGEIDLPRDYKKIARERIEGAATRCPDPNTAVKMEDLLMSCKEDGDSVGGIAELWVDGMESGIGEPVFAKLKSELARGLMSVGGVSGVELGKGFVGTRLPGLMFHDSKENYGGIQGGISSGERIVLRVGFKPTSTVGRKARTGRHDPCIVPRAIPVLEAMVYLVLADLTLEQRLNRI